MSYDSKLKSKPFLQGHVKAAHTVAVKPDYNHLTLSKKKNAVVNLVPPGQSSCSSISRILESLMGVESQLHY